MDDEDQGDPSKKPRIKSDIGDDKKDKDEGMDLDDLDNLHKSLINFPI